MRVVASGVLFSQHPSSLRGASETLLRRCFTCSPPSLAKRTLTSPLVGRRHFLVSRHTCTDDAMRRMLHWHPRR